MWGIEMPPILKSGAPDFKIGGISIPHMGDVITAFSKTDVL